MKASLAWIALLTGCSASIDSPEPDSAADTAETGEAQAAPEVLATVRVLNPMTGSGMKGIAISGGSEEVKTQTGGTAEVLIQANEPFGLRLESEKILDHLLFGTAGDDNFDLITFAGTPSTSDAVLGMLGLAWESETGMVVVGVDYSNWAPVSGAQVSLSADTAPAFVLASNGMPSLSDTVPENGMGMVSFVNVPAGEVSVEVLAPIGVTCSPYPSGENYDTVPVESSVVTVVSVQCRSESDQ